MQSQHEDIEELFWGSKSSQKHSRRRHTDDAPWALMMLIMIFFALSAVSGFMVARFYYSQGGNSFNLSGSIPLHAAGGKEESKQDNIISVMILGTDEREGETQARSDTILLAFINTQTKKIDVLSLPRDTYVKIPGVRKKTKLNHAHALGGSKLTAETLQDFLATNIDYYLETNFAGFAKIIDTIGGVDILVEKHMYYPAEGIDLQEGMQHLDGTKALQYVRFRSDGLGDIGRIQRQQKFLSEVAEKLLSPKTIVKLPAIIKSASEAVKTDMDYSTMLTLAAMAQKLNGEAITTHTVPGEPKYLSGVSYWVPDTAALKKMLQEMHIDYVPESERNTKWK